MLAIFNNATKLHEIKELGAQQRTTAIEKTAAVRGPLWVSWSNAANKVLSKFVS
jgi:hypothetical protein